MSLLMVRKSFPAHAADAAPKFRIGQEVIVKTKYTEPYRARIVGLWDMSKNGPYDEQGYLVKNIKGGGVESMPEHALSLATANDAQDANGDEVIAQKNGYKLVYNTLNDGYWFYTKSGAGWGLTATNKVAAVNEFNRLVATANDSAADASEVQRVEKLLKRELTDAEFWKLGDYVMKHMKVGKTFTDNELLSAVKDAAAADKDSARNVKYRGCEITVAYHDPDNVNLSGKTYIVKDVDGVSVGGFSSEAKAKAWIDAHPSRAADSNSR